MKNIKAMVRDGYAKVAKGGGPCCSTKKSCGCDKDYAAKTGAAIGYSESDMNSVPSGANMGLGCGNPIALASLKNGETVVDLGSGGGFDCFLAAKEVGESGLVIGVDMTPEMIDKARDNAEKGGYKNVQFRLGEIEHLPVEDGAADIVISNCVINLSPDKKQVFRDAYRVLKPGGRIMVSDIVLERELPEEIRKSVSAYIGCVAGALKKSEYLEAITEAGFGEVVIVEEMRFPIDCALADPMVQAVIDMMKSSKKDIDDLNDTVTSVRVRAAKPSY